MSRVQLALNVSDLDEAIAFYSKLFATEPAKVRPGYANFAVAEPPLKLVLIEGDGDARARSTTSASRWRRPRRSRPRRPRLAATACATATEDEVAVLLRGAGQGVGRRPRRRAVGDLHRARRRRACRPGELRTVAARAADALCCASAPESAARCC